MIAPARLRSLAPALLLIAAAGAAPAPQASSWDHWSFKPPVRPPVPAVKNGSWARNPIDALIAAMDSYETMRKRVFQDDRARTRFQAMLADHVYDQVNASPSVPPDADGVVFTAAVTGTHFLYVDGVVSNSSGPYRLDLRTFNAGE